MTAGLGRPLILTTLEVPEAMRILGGGSESLRPLICDDLPGGRAHPALGRAGMGRHRSDDLVAAQRDSDADRRGGAAGARLVRRRRQRRRPRRHRAVRRRSGRHLPGAVADRVRARRRRRSRPAIPGWNRSSPRAARPSPLLSSARPWRATATRRSSRCSRSMASVSPSRIERCGSAPRRRPALLPDPAPRGPRGRRVAARAGDVSRHRHRAARLRHGGARDGRLHRRYGQGGSRSEHSSTSEAGGSRPSTACGWRSRASRGQPAAGTTGRPVSPRSGRLGGLRGLRPGRGTGPDRARHAGAGMRKLIARVRPRDASCSSSSRRLALAAVPSPSAPVAGDTRSAGEGPGLVGAPLLAILLVVALGVGHGAGHARLCPALETGGGRRPGRHEPDCPGSRSSSPSSASA